MDNNTNANANENTDFILIDTELIHALNEIKITNGKEIMLFAKLLAMSERKGFCCPSNRYLARILCVSERNITRYLTDLETKELLKMSYHREGADTKDRIIRPNLSKLNEGVDNIVGGRQFRPTELSRGVDNIVGGRQFRPTISSDNIVGGRQNCPTELSRVDNFVRQNCPSLPKLSNKYNMSFGASQGGEEGKEIKNKENTNLDTSLLRSFTQFPESQDKELKEKRKEVAYKLVSSTSINANSSFQEKRDYYFAKGVIAYPLEPELEYKEIRAEEYAKGIRKWSDKDQKMFEEGIKEIENERK